MNNEKIKIYLEKINSIFESIEIGQGFTNSQIKNIAEQEYRYQQKEINEFYTILNILVHNGYLLFDGKEHIKLTQKGYDYLHGRESLELRISYDCLSGLSNNVIDQMDNNDIYNILWMYIGKEDEDLFCIKGPKFYDTIHLYLNGLPLSYTDYLDQRRDENISTSRRDWYRDLFIQLPQKKVVKAFLSQLFDENIDMCFSLQG